LLTHHSCLIPAAYAWGKPGESVETNNAVDQGVGGQFLSRLEKTAKEGFFQYSDVTDKLFYVGVTAGLRANQQEGLVCGIWAANTVGESMAVDATNATGDFLAFCKDLESTDPRGNNYANVDGFLTTHSIDLDHHAACVFVAKESDAVPTTLIREGALATGTVVIEVGVLTRLELEHVIASYNQQPWDDKAGFDAAVASTPAPVSPVDDDVSADADDDDDADASASAKIAVSTTAEAGGTKRAAPVVQQQISSEYIVLDNDNCLGKTAPSLESLDIMHYPEGVAEGTVNYADNKATVVCFWSKIHKGNYPTINMWSDIAETFEQDVRFVGCARDADQAQVAKYVERVGTSMPELGVNGIVTSGGIILAYDVANAVNTGFKIAAGMKTLGVDNAFIVDSAGTIQWRTLFNRGEEPSGQFESQLRLVVEGKPVDLCNPAPPESDSEEEVEEEAGDENAAGIKTMMVADY
jgi:hypothetical protein